MTTQPTTWESIAREHRHRPGSVLGVVERALADHGLTVHAVDVVRVRRGLKRLEMLSPKIQQSFTAWLLGEKGAAVLELVHNVMDEEEG